MFSFAQNGADPAGADIARTMFDKDTHAIFPRGIDNATEVDSAGRLIGQRRGHRFARGGVVGFAGVGVETYTGYGLRLARVNLVPGLLPALHHRMVGDNFAVVLDRAVVADLLDSTAAGVGLARYQAIGRGIDHGEGSELLSRQRGLHLFYRR